MSGATGALPQAGDGAGEAPSTTAAVAFQPDAVMIEERPLPWSRAASSTSSRLLRHHRGRYGPRLSQVDRVVTARGKLITSIR